MPLWLAGGGSPQQEAEVWRRAFEGVECVTYWPFALPDERIPDTPEWFRTALAELEIDVTVDVWPSLEGRAPGQLADTDLLFVGGGVTSKLLHHIVDHDFGTPIRDFARAGGRYYGGSAGALIACESIAIAAVCDADQDAADAPPALGLLPGLTVLPHADTFPADQISRWAEAFGALLTLPEACGVEVIGPELRVLGPDDAGLIAADTRTLAAGTTTVC